MRTTVTLDDDVLRAAKALANATSKSVGAVISELARKGLSASGPGRVKRGFPVFDVGPGARPITLDDVKKLEYGP